MAKRLSILLVVVLAPAAGVFAAEGHREFAIVVCVALLAMLLAVGVWTWLGWRAEGKVNSELKHG